MSENIPHSLGGFRGAFESEHGRKPTEQEIWNAAIRSWRDITRQKSDAVKEQVVEDLLMYAGDNGYSHIDYADTMRHAAALLQSPALPVGELTEMRFDSDCVVNGVQVKAGTVFPAAARSQPASEQAYAQVVATQTWFDGDRLITRNLTADDIYKPVSPQNNSTKL